jgi:AraC-like DNA-binding protein
MPAEFFNSLLTLKSKLVYAGGVCGHWGIDHNSDTTIWLHLVTKGDSWVHYPDSSKVVLLGEGDLLVFLPHSEPHYLSYSPDELRFDAPDARKTTWEEGTTAFVCALIDLALPKAYLWQVLPTEILVRRNDADDALADLTRHTVTEARQQRFGSYSVIERLCDSIFVLMVRHCVENGVIGEGALAALHDKRLETVLSLIHREPWAPWTVVSLGARVGKSKTVLTEKFSRLMGCPPGEYLVKWRMQTAANWLKESPLPVEVVAERCGYNSVSAFSRTFTRCYGVSPGAFRIGVQDAERVAIGGPVVSSHD